MVQLALGFLFQNIFSRYEKSFGKLKYRTLSDAYIIISGVKNFLCSALLKTRFFKPLFKYIYDNFIHVYVVIKKIIMNLIKNKNVCMTSILLFVLSVGVAFEVFYMYLVYTPDGIVLVSRYYITCLNLLFSNRRVQIYI